MRTVIARQNRPRKRRNFETDDIVLLVCDATPRSQSLIEIIVSVYTDAHGTVRSVLVKTRDLELRRPIQNLFLIVPAQGQRDGGRELTDDLPTLVTEKDDTCWFQLPSTS